MRPAVVGESDVAPGKTKIKVRVGVGEAVSVKRGVGVKVVVAVEVGIAAAVWEEAAFAVCTMKVLTAPGTGDGTMAGLATVGMQAIMSANAASPMERFFLLILLV